MRLAVVVALGCVVSACYSPELAPCSVRCTDGCPASLECRNDGFCHASDDPGGECEPDAGGGDDYLEISVGDGHVCARRQGGLVRCWGANDHSQLGVVTATTGEPQDLPGVWDVVSVGAQHTCGLHQGSLSCWGANAVGQAGDPSFVDVAVPRPVDLSDDWFAVSTGWQHTCGIRGASGSGGTLYCWGSDTLGQCGDGSPGAPSSTPTAVAEPEGGGGVITDWVAVDAGGGHTCARSHSRGVFCWGENDHGELGANDTAPHPAPIEVVTAVQLDTVSAGTSATCGVSSTGDLYCWGDNSNGQLGTSTASPAMSSVPIGIGTGGGYTSVSMGGSGGCAVHQTVVRCWGAAAEGQYGNDTWDFARGLHAVTGLDGIIGVSAGGTTNCAVDGIGHASCWGNDASGQLGAGTVATQVVPEPIATTQTGWQRVSAGVDHTCAIRSGNPADPTVGELWCWGWGTNQQLGNGADDSASPIQVPGTGWTDVVLGFRSTCALKATDATQRQLWCWGADGSGQLGNGALNGDRPPARIGADSDWTGLAAAAGAVCGLRGTARSCWGEQASGQLGNGQGGGNVLAPEAEADGPWTDVALGFGFGCGVRNGNLACWGDDSQASCGNGPGDTSSLTAVDAESTHVWTEVVAGGAHACGISGPDVYCWGANNYDQTGVSGAGGNVDAPAIVLGADAVTAGGLHTCALAGDNLFCWGDNDRGQLGDPATFPVSPDPLPIATTIPWAQVSAGNLHTCGVTTGGDLYCWGDGRHGQLGDGTHSSAVPVTTH